MKIKIIIGISIILCATVLYHPIKQCIIRRIVRNMLEKDGYEIDSESMRQPGPISLLWQ